MSQQNKSLKFLYNTVVGRIILKIITRKTFSKIVGILLNSRISQIEIKRYIKKHEINMEKFEEKKYKSFNDFFIRNIKKINKNSQKNEFISTAESRISFYNITEDLVLNIKKSKYSIKELIKDENISNKYRGGICLVYRLEPSNFHRYIFIDDGTQEKLKRIEGKLHTVNPIVYDKYKVFTENTREVSLLKTENFGEVIQIEVGALCVGKISNNNKIKFEKYDEKGYFEFGGSTIIQLIEKDKIKINETIIENTKNNIETLVEVGEIIGKNI